MPQWAPGAPGIVADVIIAVRDLGNPPRLRSSDRFLFYLLQYSRRRHLTMPPWVQGAPRIVADVINFISDLENPPLRRLDRFFFHLKQYSRRRRLTLPDWAPGAPGIVADVTIAIRDLENPPTKKLRSISLLSVPMLLKATSNRATVGTRCTWDSRRCHNRDQGSRKPPD